MRRGKIEPFANTHQTETLWDLAVKFLGKRHWIHGCSHDYWIFHRGCKCGVLLDIWPFKKFNMSTKKCLNYFTLPASKQVCVCVCVWLKIKQSISWQVFLWSIWYFCKFLCVGAHSRITEVIPESVICICCTLHSPSLSLWLCWAWWLLWSFAPRSWAKSDHRCSWGGPVDKINK